MAVLKQGSRKKIFRISLLVAGTLVLIVIFLHLWFVNNARNVLKAYISEQSQGKIQLNLSELGLNLWTNRLNINEAVLVSTDSLTAPITYHVSFSKLSLKVGSIWALLFQKRLLLDSVKLYNPSISIYQWKKDTTKSLAREDLSIPQEMGKVYNSMQEALEEFGIRRIVIDNAQISLIDKIKNNPPVTVSGIFLDLARTLEEGKKHQFLKNEQTVELTLGQQDIALPGGRHNISFKSFNLRLFRETIELDSCTITASPGDSIKSNYRIFFNKLHFTGVDFAALSENRIKADTVYCEEPQFNFNLYRTDAVKKKTELPDPDKIIRELTGDFDLAYVEVKNAGLHFNVYGKSQRSFFNSNKDNFLIKNFRINPDSIHPVSVGVFDMTLRDYHLYNEDSSSAFSFDSLHFLNSRIVLNNFVVNSRPSRTRKHILDVKVPYFELSDLNWYKLIFDQEMVAKEAVMINPVISYKRQRPSAGGKKMDLFDALLNLDSMVSLENVSIRNGQVNMQLGPTTSFNVQQIDFKINSDRLMLSKNKEGLRNAVEFLSFSKGVLRTKDLTAQLKNARFTGKNLVFADQVILSGMGNKIAATINHVNIDNVQLDDITEAIEVEGLKWQSATVNISSLPAGKNKKQNNSSSLIIKNVEGKQTSLKVSSGAATISTFINELAASALYKKGNDPLRVEGFMLKGNDLLVTNKQMILRAGSYDLLNNAPSSLDNIRLQQIKGSDSLSIISRRIGLIADLNRIIAGDLHFQSVQADGLVFNMVKRDSSGNSADTTSLKQSIRIENLTAIEPAITIATHRNDSSSTMKIPWSKNSSVKASDIHFSEKGMHIGGLKINTSSATFVKQGGEVMGIEKGRIDMDLTNINFANRNGKMNWSGSVNLIALQNAGGLGMGKTKNKLLFEQASVGNLHLSSEYLPDFGQLMKANISAWLHIPEGRYIDSITTLKWHNARYDNTQRTLSLDSFIYHPTKSLDSVLAHAPYQLDYITLKTGVVTISGLDVTQYEKDSSFIAGEIKINDPVFTVYKDQGPPPNPFKKEKPLLVNVIKKIGLPVHIKRIGIENGIITYSEKNKTSDKEGHLVFTNVYAQVENIKNRENTIEDSLSLMVQASLMGAAALNLRMKQSYTDSLSGFVLETTLKGTDLSIMNPFLVPVANVKITKGTLDSLAFRAVGREDLALGNMDLHYHDLKIKLIKEGDPEHSTLFQHALSFLANTFLIKNKNNNRTGVMYAKHTSDQSFINYVVKMTLSGLTTSAGLKKNRKLLREYRKELETSGKPEIIL